MKWNGVVWREGESEVLLCFVHEDEVFAGWVGENRGGGKSGVDAL